MLPDVQLALRAGIVEFGWGHPDVALLPAARMAEAARLAIEEAGPAALSYGAEQGSGRLLDQLSAWLTRRESHAPPLDQLMITGGASQALDLLCTLLARPGDVVLVESPVYHLALRIFRDHDLRLMPVAADEEGIQPAALAAVLANLRRQKVRPRFLYTVPTFGNPSGATLAPVRRQALLTWAERDDLLIIEDDVYHELWYEAPAPSSLYDLSPGRVVRLGSFSKVLGPGLRLGWLATAPTLVARLRSSGLLDSGGGVNHFTAHVVASFMAQGWLDENVEALRIAYRGRRDALCAALADNLPQGCEWRKPGGGFFVWLRLPEGLDSAALLPAAEAAGVSYVPGARFCVEAGCRPYCRLAFTLLPVEEMQEGARRLAAVVREAAGAA